MTLTDRLAEEQALIEAFIALLDEEAAALLNGNLDQLPALTERKGELAERIVSVDRTREEEQQRLGYADGCGNAADEALQDAWRSLLKCADTARGSNYRNGVLIHTHLDFTRAALSVLSATGKPLYGRDGQHQPVSPGSNNLASG